MSAATPTAGTRPFVLTAADFATNPEAVVAQLGWSFEVPSAGVLVSAGARASTAPAPARSPAIGAGPSQSIPRPSKRPRQDLLGRCFLVRWGDVCDLWPQWEYCNRNRVPWRVLAHASSHDRLQCQYRGASDDNRALIGNGGVREFALDHRFKSLESLRDLLPSVPKYPYGATNGDNNEDDDDEEDAAEDENDTDTATVATSVIWFLADNMVLLMLMMIMMMRMRMPTRVILIRSRRPPRQSQMCL
jgi:hypothetical protein